jgi:NAD(P) transhydrogenase subunit alpha
VVDRHGVHFLGYTDLPSRPGAARLSLLFGNNLTHLLADLGGASHFHLDLARPKVGARRAGAARTEELLWPPRHARRRAAARTERRRRRKHCGDKPGQRKAGLPDRFSQSSARCAVGLGLVAPPAFLSHLTVFALACIVGWQVVWNVTPALHTPLMSVTNAISGIIVIGGMLQVSGPPPRPITILGAAAILLATINIAGGFLVTQRMLRMFRR